MSETTVLWIIGSLFSLVVLLVGRYEYVSRKAQDERFAIANKIHDDRLFELTAHLNSHIEASSLDREQIHAIQERIQGLHERYEEKLSESLAERERLKIGLLWTIDELTNIANSLGLKLSSRPKV